MENNTNKGFDSGVAHYANITFAKMHAMDSLEILEFANKELGAEFNALGWRAVSFHWDSNNVLIVNFANQVKQDFRIKRFSFKDA